MLTFIVRYGYVPFMLLGINGAAIALAASGAPKWSLVALILFAVVCSFAAERALPTNLRGMPRDRTGFATLSMRLSTNPSSWSASR